MGWLAFYLKSSGWLSSLCWHPNIMSTLPYLGACLALRKGSFIQANLQHLILTAQVQIPADGDCKWLIERRIAPGTC